MDENAGWEKARTDRKMIDDRSVGQHGTTDLTGIFRKVTIEKGSDPSEPSAFMHSSSSREHPDGVDPSHLNRDDKGSAPIEGDLSFTQLFQSVSVKPAAEPQQRPAEPAVTQQESSSDKQHRSTSVFSNPEPPREAVHDPVTSPSSPGEFTALFNTIRSSSEVFELPSPSPYLGNSRFPEPNPIGGGFTQLLRTLSDDDVSTPPFGVTSGATEKLPPREPGEFTQIVSRSVMREATLREEQAPSASDSPIPLPSLSENRQAISNDLQSPSMVPLVMPIPLAPHLQPSERPSPEASNEVRDATSVDRWQKHLPLLIMVNLTISLLTLSLVAITLLRQH